MAKKPQARTSTTTASGVPRRLDAPEAELKDISPDNLLLDPANLRLLELSDDIANSPARLIATRATQQRVLDLLCGTPDFEIEKLRESIIANTFLRHERLVVCPFSHNDYLVLEGNRRLSAVKSILRDPDSVPPEARREVLSSITSLPCLVLRGPSVGSDEKRLANYRRDATVYVGMRHLMGATAWEPASRYEFQARLIDDEHWTIAEVAKRFGRREREVIRDLAAQRLFQDFQSFRQKRRLTEQFTYNIFAEAARASSIMRWLKWSDDKNDFEDDDNKVAFFRYVIHELGKPREDGPRRDSAERVVRDLREMLKLEDDDVESALEAGNYDRAKILFDARKDGKLHTVVDRMTTRLEDVRVGDIGTNRNRILSSLKSLQAATANLIQLVTAAKGSDEKADKKK